MKLAVVVGHGRLFCMAESGNDCHNPDHPVVGHEEFGGHVFSQADCYIDCGEPEVTAEAVEDSSDARILAGHSGELAVGTVK